MKLTTFLRKLGVEGENQERLVREVTRCFGLLPTQSELLRINKNLDVYPAGYQEYAKPLEHFVDFVFKDDKIQLIVFDIFRTLYLLERR